MSVKTLFILFCFSFLVSLSLSAQEDELFLEELPEFNNKKKRKHSFSKEKLKIGGNLGGGYANDQIYVHLSPAIGYRLFKYWELGTGLVYQYRNDRILRFTTFSTHIIGGRVYTRIYPWKELYIHVEGVVQNAQVRIDNTNNNAIQRRTFGNLFLGAGHNVAISKHIQLSISLLVNILRNKLNPFITVYPDIGIFYKF